VTAILLFVLEGLILVILSVDLSRGFTPLSSLERVALLTGAALGLACATWPGRRAPGRWLASILALGAGCLALGTLGVLQNRDARLVKARWEISARDRLETRARVIEEDFRGFLEELSRPLTSGRVSIEDRGAAFAALARMRSSSRLPADRLGFAVYQRDDTLFAWDGNSSSTPQTLLGEPCPGPVYVIGGREASRRLFAAVCAPEGGRLVTEFLLEPPEGGDTRDTSSGLGFLPHSQETSPASVRFREAPSEQDDIAQLFERQGDRHWGRLGDEGVSTLALPLRSPNGERLAIVTLRDRPSSQEILDRRRDFRLAGGLALALSIALAWCLPLRAGAIRSSAARLLAGTAAIWMIRWAFLAMVEPAALPRLSIYDISIYASSRFWGLLRSPADLLLTAAACCLQIWILDLALRRAEARDEPPAGRGARYSALGSLFLAFVVAAVALHSFLNRLVLDARLDVSRVEFGTIVPARLTLQAALFLFVMSAGLLLRCLLDRALRFGPRSGDGAFLRRLRGADSEGIPFALRAATWMLLLTLAYAPALHHSYDRLRRDFFQDELRPLVLDQESMRRQTLNDSLALSRDPDFAAIAAADGSHDAAYRLWRATPVADRGLASSLRIFDERGDLLGRFALDFAPMLEAPFEEAKAAARKDFVFIPPRPELTVRKPVLLGARWVGGVRQPLLVVLMVSDDYDNLPILGGDTVGAGLFRPPAERSNPELLRSEPLVAVFSPTLARLYESGGEIPPPSAATLAAVGRDRRAWTKDNLRGGEAFILYFRGPHEIFALAHLHASRTAILAGYLRLFLLNGFLALLLVGFARVAFWTVRPSLPRISLGATYSRRLVTAFLMAGLFPLLTLAFFATHSTTREIDRNITTSGFATLSVARRVAEDYLTVSRPEEGASLDDDVVYWLRRVVRQDINVYRDSALLATSTRELYSSGLLNERLSGESYRAVYLDREPFWLSEERSGDLDFLTMAAPMRLDQQGTIGAISIPLVEHRRAAAYREEEIQDTVLIITCGAILLLAIVGNVLAQRVSRPVAHLARAVRRVATGDLDVRVDTTASDETAVLVEAFNIMADSLRKQREDLRRHADYIEKILRSATTGVLSIDASGIIITINPAAQALLTGSLGPPEAGRDLKDHLTRDTALAPLLAALRRAPAGRAEREVEVEIAGTPRGPHADSEDRGPRRMRAVFIPFAPEEGGPPGSIILLEDITEIVRSGRLAAWADMARRVAHEIKNPLTPIQLSVEHVRRVFRAKDPRFGAVLSECLENIQKQVAVLREIAFEFSAYARLPQLRPEPIAVSTLVDEALRPYVSAAPPGVHFERDVPTDVPPVLVDRAVMVRALVNLIENALQAMPSGGRLSVSASATDGSRGERHVTIKVRDSGQGIPEEILPHLFEPYFSTKSGGTGLGLGLARRAVEEHGGTIDIRSRSGQGTVVVLTLPAAAMAAGAAPAGRGPQEAGR